MTDPARQEQRALTARWIDTAVRPDLYPPPVQRERSGEAASDVPAGDIHRLAAEGVSGSAAAFPYRERIQRSFGHHDISGIEAHIGGPATRASETMGARAYATGNHVAFGTQPDLHTAAHEAAHVVQQRAGVSLSGGVGQAGDAYERHADRVADLVVAGQNAESLLSEMAGGAAAGSAVQMSFDELSATVRSSSDERPNARQPSPRQQAVAALTTWCRENQPERARLDAFLDGVTEASHDEAIRITGELAREIARMEFLLGDLYHQGDRNWERGVRADGTRAGNDQGELVDQYQQASNAQDGAWCTKFAGYAYSRIDSSALGDRRTRFWSGYRLQSWAAENGGERIASSAFRAHKRALEGVTGADEEARAQRHQLTDTFLAGQGGDPRPGEVLVVTRSTARRRNNDGSAGASGSARYDNSFTRQITRTTENGQTEVVQGGALSHTVMVDSYDPATKRISTIEGNADNRVTGREFDVSVPESEGGVDGVGRMISLVMMDPAVFRNDRSHEGGEDDTPVSEDTLATGRALVEEVRALNQRLAAMSIELGAIQGTPDSTVRQWEHGDEVAGDMSES